MAQNKDDNDDVIEVKVEPGTIDLLDDNGADDDINELEHLRKLFIGGLSVQTTEQSLKDFYSQWGKVVDVVVMRDPNTKRSRGFGFITYIKSSSVNTAQANRPHIIDNKTVEAKRALPRPERENRETNVSVKKLFVGGLKDNHDEQCLREYFTQFGNVISIRILTDRVSGKRRGFAFIEFDDYDAVDKAILQKQHSIKYVIVDVKKSVYKQEKKHLNGESNGMDDKNRLRLKMNGQQAPMMQRHHPMPPPTQHGMPYQQPPPMNGMNGGPSGPPPNWGPPPQVHSGYGNYQQPPPPAPMQNWNSWNAGPQPPVNGWQGNQWGYPPVAPPPPLPNGNSWNTQVPPPGSVTPLPQQQVQPPPAQTPIAPLPQNFGTGYQQSFGGGPVKHNGNNPNRMNPYSAPPTNYAANAPPVSYGGYVAPISKPPTAVPVPPVGSKYRR